MTGEFMDLLSKEGQERVRKIDQVFIRESQRRVQDIWCFDFRPIDPLPIEPEMDEEGDLLAEEKVAREIGIFI